MNPRYLILIIFFAFIINAPAEAQKNNKRKHKKDQQAQLTDKQKYEQSDLFAQGLIQKQLKNYNDALNLFSKALLIDSDDAASHFEVSKIMLALGRNDEALEAAALAVKDDENNIWYKANFAKASRLNDNYDDYVRTYEELVEAEPYDINFVYELAFAYQFTGDYRNAIIAYDKIEELMGISEIIISNKTDFYAKIGEPENGIKEIEKLINTNPFEPRYYALLAEYCSKHGYEDAAVNAYEKIVEINPNDPYVHISLADFYSKKGDKEKAFEELKIGMSNPDLDINTKINLLASYYSTKLDDNQKQQALELSEIITDIHIDDPLASSFYASMLYENADYISAEPIFREIVNADNGNYMAWEQLLFCDLYLEDFEKLTLDAEDCIDYFPNYPLPYFFAGLGNFQIRDFVKAKAFLESGKDFVVNNNALLEQFYSTLGDTYNELGNYVASYSAYDKVLKINPDNSIVLNNYAYYLSLRSYELDKAKEMSAKSVKLDPYNSSNIDTYAWVLYKMEDFDMALKWIKKAYNNGGENSGAILEHYGDILFKLGKISEANEYWLRAKQTTGYSDYLDKKIKTKEIYE
ncbi:MAG: tetratricopeptide repeat protein [Bacteroidales bacterium]|jgi:tetratricopeptide (TPR) repeat protein|nr:hypothetical protein [Lentimicrobiaceae bacterium]MDG1135451.1 tetratricopeptide repeat protein [Bacteroidales bacterium]MDG1901807.1 tetratricopeptide repeat protein [Bacteroidales bacterium]MDG2081131.1 tetratricopeptide repeat protein [Bacteroidales bacterium]|tara:strand:+ start:2308 stop:4047 length:1740 start_codon:yes stop_codon:yes gene_type:complete